MLRRTGASVTTSRTPGLIRSRVDTVTHHVEVSLFPNWLGTAQLRYHKREGNMLTLRTPPIPSGDGGCSGAADVGESCGREIVTLKE